MKLIAIITVLMACAAHGQHVAASPEQVQSGVCDSKSSDNDGIDADDVAMLQIKLEKDAEAGGEEASELGEEEFQVAQKAKEMLVGEDVAEGDAEEVLDEEGEIEAETGRPSDREVMSQCKRKKVGTKNLWSVAKIACKHGVSPGDKRACQFDVCMTGKTKYAGDNYVEKFLEMAYAGHLLSHVGRGKCLDNRDQPFTMTVARKRGLSRKQCADFLMKKSKGNQKIRAAQWKSRGNVCVLYSSTGYVKGVQKEKAYDCFKVLS